MKLDSYDMEDATHLLKCRHQQGRNGFNYTMPCIIIGRTKSRKVKIVVFGERWDKQGYKKRVRYVPSWQVMESCPNRPNSRSGG